MFIKNSEFSIDKFLLLVSISWLIHLKKIPKNKIKAFPKRLVQQNKGGLVS